MTLRTHTAAVLLTAALVAGGCGDDDAGQSGVAPAGGNGVDRAFVAEMVPHHAAAVQMAQIASKRARSAFVKDLAKDIVTTQSAEIATLRREDGGLDTAGVEVGSLGVPEHMMGMDHDVASLETAAPFDKAFLTMMIPHHQGAIEMSNAELARGKDPELRALARDIIEAQAREIAAMRAQLATTS